MAALDRTVSACDDFYRFACGGWEKATSIPEDQPLWMRSFSVIGEQNERRLQKILERAAAGTGGTDPDAAALGSFYASCMDEAAIEKAGTGSLAAELARLAAVKDVAGLGRALARLNTLGVAVPFDFYVTPNLMDASRTIGELWQAGLGLPEPGYYLDGGRREDRERYERHVAAMLAMLEADGAAATRSAAAVMRLEHELARASMSNVEMRDPRALHHPLSPSGLVELAPSFPWEAYFAELGVRTGPSVNVAQPRFIQAVATLITRLPLGDWIAYLRWHLLRRAVPALPARFVEEDLRYQQALTGVQALPPRWKRCVRAVDRGLGTMNAPAGMGDALGRAFVQQTLGVEGRRQVEAMVRAIEAAMEERLGQAGWMDEPTRRRALSKLQRTKNKLGYPDRWRDYRGLRIDRGDYLGNLFSAYRFEVRRQLAQLGQPVDRSEWHMTPSSTSSSYDRALNEMLFPAGTLQPPLFSTQMAPAVAYGGIGMTIGHELVHGFDDEGRQFDAEGNLNDWWSPSVGAEFGRRAACVARQFDRYVAIDDVHVDGKLSLGENLADLGGVRLAFDAFRRAHPEAPALDGFTPEQQFFLGFAQGWCAKLRPETLRLSAPTDPHAPPRLRVNGPLSNLPEFAAAFSCPASSPMVAKSEDRCEVW